MTFTDALLQVAVVFGVVAAALAWIVISVKVFRMLTVSAKWGLVSLVWSYLNTSAVVWFGANHGWWSP